MVACQTDEAPGALGYWEVQDGHDGHRAPGQVPAGIVEITDKVCKATCTARVCFLNFPK